MLHFKKLKSARKNEKNGIRTHEAVIVTFFYLQTDRIPLQPEQASCTATFRAAFPRYRTVYSFRYTPCSASLRRSLRGALGEQYEACITEIRSSR